MMFRGADISFCDLYRWTLTRVWNQRLPMALFIMLNPSTADDQRDDPTILRLIHFCRLWGYGGFIVCNMYPFRSPHPKILAQWYTQAKLQTDWRIANERRLVVCAHKVELVVVAWGNGSPQGTGYNEYLLKRLGRIKPLHCFGITKQGHPKHPLARGVHRIPNNQQPILWAKAG